jgi:hypothetical protein
MSNVMTVRAVGNQLFHMDRRKERHCRLTNLTVVFSNFTTHLKRLVFHGNRDEQTCKIRNHLT